MLQIIPLVNEITVIAIISTSNGNAVSAFCQPLTALNGSGPGRPAAFFYSTQTPQTNRRRPKLETGIRGRPRRPPTASLAQLPIGDYTFRVATESALQNLCWLAPSQRMRRDAEHCCCGTVPVSSHPSIQTKRPPGRPRGPLGRIPYIADRQFRRCSHAMEVRIALVALVALLLISTIVVWIYASRP